MKLLAIALLGATLLAGATAGPRAAGGSVPRHAAPRLQCEQPARLRLERYEDGSARLLCGPRLLARIGVPW